MNNRSTLTINEVSEGKMICSLSWGSFLAAYLLPFLIFAPLIIYLVYKDKFTSHAAIFDNLKSALKLFIANIIVVVVSYLMVFTIILIPVAIVLGVVMTVLNIVLSIKGLMRITNVKTEGQNFDYIEDDQ